MSIWGNVILPQKDGFIYGANEPGVTCLWFNTAGAEIPADPDVSHGMLLYRDSDGLLHPLYPMTTISAVYGLDKRLEELTKYVDASARKAAPRNLLDNSDFRNPVNQRRIASGAAVGSYAYFIDRWINGEESSIAPNMSSNGIKPNGAFYQNLDSLASYVGKKMTFAVGLSSGNVVTASGTLTNATTDDVFIFDTTDGSNKIAVGSVEGLWYAWIDYPSSTIQWAALYEGEYTAETLPEYHPKGYGAELAECQRYYQIRSANNIAAVNMRPTMRLSSPTIASVTGGYAYSADL